MDEGSRMEEVRPKPHSVFGITSNNNPSVMVLDAGTDCVLFV